MEARIRLPLLLISLLALVSLAVLGSGVVITDGDTLKLDGTTCRLKDTDRYGRSVSVATSTLARAASSAALRALRSARRSSVRASRRLPARPSQCSFEALRPLPGAVIDAQDLQLIAADLVGNNVRGVWDGQFAGTGNPARPAEVGSVLQIRDTSAKAAKERARRLRIVVCDVEEDVAKIVARLWRDNNPHALPPSRACAFCSISVSMSAMTPSKGTPSPRAREA